MPTKTVIRESELILDSIRKIVKALRESSRRAEREIGLSSAQVFVLTKVAESREPLSINELAKRTLTHQSSVSVVVSKLEKKGLLSRVASKTDARAVEVELTPRGRKLLEGIPETIQDRLIEAIQGLSSAKREGLLGGLATLVEKAGLDDEEAALFFEDTQGGSK